jgi:ParB family chromosome partitioning protein
MSHRIDAIRSLMAAAQPDALSADNKSSLHVSAGSVRSLKHSFTDTERENEELRTRLASGVQIIEIDPGLIDPSPVADRFAEQDDASFDALKGSIAQRGQEVPILVREHPSAPGRYQSAYGHRRIRVARELGRMVKAVIRTLSDQDLIIAQGVENSAREDLSFIERAVFAVKLEDAGHDRSVVQEALSVDRAEASKLIAVARSVPGDLIGVIGRAPKVGRGRWQALADSLKEADALQRARKASRDAGFAQVSTDDRFLLVLQAATRTGKIVAALPRASITSTNGQLIAHVQHSGKDLKLVMHQDDGFAAYLIDQLPVLFETYVAVDRKGYNERRCSAPEIRSGEKKGRKLPQRLPKDVI